MDAAPPLTQNRKLFATAFIVAAVGLISSLNLLLPMTLEHRHFIGCGLMIVSLILCLFGLAVLFGEKIVSIIKPRWNSWTIKKRIVVCASLYGGAYVVGFIGCAVYQNLFRRWAYYNLPPEIYWWFQ